ncbi:hypothetical protein C8R47DRAFT_1210493 [Mycena vitilis]|nr:hypothetical protein C8R47DRAFT_1210493 [Mycena vitilis]
MKQLTVKRAEYHRTVTQHAGAQTAASIKYIRCGILAKNNVLLGLSKRWGRPDPYFRPLIESYAIRALGLHVGAPFTSPMVLIFHFGLVSLTSGVYTNRLSIEHISLIPMAILQRDTEKMCQWFLAAGASVREPDTHFVSLMFNPCIDANLGPAFPSDCLTC